MKLKKEKLKEINDLYSLLNKADKEIAAKNILKEFWLKQIIKELEETNFLKSIRNIEEVISARFNIWNDVEDPNWTELELLIKTKKSRDEFDGYDNWEIYELPIRDKIYKILDDNPNLNDIISVDIER